MDWSKAKTILIAVFFTINVLLVNNIILTRNGSNSYLDSEKIEQVVNYLNNNNVVLSTEIPRKKANLPSVTVRYKIFRKDDIAAGLLASAGEIEEAEDNGILVLKAEDLELRIKDGKELSYRDNAVKPAESKADDAACRKAIVKFCSKLGIAGKGMRLAAVSEENGYMKYVYQQKYKNYIIYNSFMEFYVNESGVHKADIIWFDTVKQAGTAATVLSPLDALASAFEHYRSSSVTGFEVLSMEEGYYFGIGANDQVDVSKIEEGTAFPVWKVSTDKGILYINAFNNRIEGIEQSNKNFQ